MSGNELTYVFETEEGRALHAAWARGDETPALTFDELIGLVFPALPNPTERLAAFTQLLTPEQTERAVALLYTIDRLREGRVESADEVEFAFNELPDTPKNREIRELFVRYGESELKDDRTAQIRLLVDNLNAGAVTFGGKRVKFVKARGPSAPWFGEVAGAFGNAVGVEEAALVEPWELGGMAGSRRGLTLYGEGATAIASVAHAVSALVVRRTDPADIVIPFAGDLKALHYLRHSLHHHEIPFRVLLPEEATPAPVGESAVGLAQILTALRRDTARALRERLEMSAAILEGAPGRRARDTWESFFERLVAREKLRPDQAPYLTALLGPAAEPRREPRENRGGVLIVPFGPLPAFPGSASVAYADATVLRPPRTPLLFKEGEVELLHGRGFVLPRVAAYRERMMELFTAYTARAGRRRLLVSALPPGAFPQAGRSGTVAKKAAPHDPHGEVPFDATTGRYRGAWESARLASPLTKPLSATQLETYAKCPALYFFSQRLKLRPAEMGDDKYPLLFGQATHRALENYFKQLGTRPARPAPDVMVTELRGAFREAVREVAPGLDETHPLFVILRENFARLAKHVPTLETKLTAVAGSLTPTAFEQEFTIDLGDVSVKGKIDRVDRRADGALLVLDYKTGTVDFTPDHINQGHHFQALLYLVAVEKTFHVPCVGILFYDLKKGEARRGVLFEELVEKDAKRVVTRGHILSEVRYGELRDQGMARLHEIAGKLVAGSFPPASSPEACQVCDYAALCRKRVGYA